MNTVLARVLAGVTVAAGAAVLTGTPVAEIAGGLLLALVLPGLAVTATLFRGRAVSVVERTVLAPALSLAVLVLGGLVIYVSRFALDRTSWTLATGGLTLLALILPAVRPARPAAGSAEAREVEIAYLAAAAGRAVEGASHEVGEERIRLRPDGGADGATLLLPVVPQLLSVRGRQRPPLGRIGRQSLPLILVLVVLGGAGWLSLHSARESYDTTVTALSAAPPAEAGATAGRTVTVTASGLIAADGPYRVAVFDATGTRISTRTVAVPRSGNWTASVAVGRGRTTVNLYRSSDVAAYRTLYVAAAT